MPIFGHSITKAGISSSSHSKTSKKKKKISSCIQSPRTPRASNLGKSDKEEVSGSPSTQRSKRHARNRATPLSKAGHMIPSVVTESTSDTATSTPSSSSSSSGPLQRTAVPGIKEPPLHVIPTGKPPSPAEQQQQQLSKEAEQPLETVRKTSGGFPSALGVTHAGGTLVPSSSVNSEEGVLVSSDEEELMLNTVQGNYNFNNSQGDAYTSFLQRWTQHNKDRGQQREQLKERQREQRLEREQQRQQDQQHQEHQQRVGSHVSRGSINTSKHSLNGTNHNSSNNDSSNHDSNLEDSMGSLSFLFRRRSSSGASSSHRRSPSPHHRKNRARCPNQTKRTKHINTNRSLSISPSPSRRLAQQHSTKSGGFGTTKPDALVVFDSSSSSLNHQHQHNNSSSLLFHESGGSYELQQSHTTCSPKRSTSQTFSGGGGGGFLVPPRSFSEQRRNAVSPQRNLFGQRRRNVDASPNTVDGEVMTSPFSPARQTATRKTSPRTPSATSTGAVDPALVVLSPTPLTTTPGHSSSTPRSISKKTSSSKKKTTTTPTTTKKTTTVSDSTYRSRSHSPKKKTKKKTKKESSTLPRDPSVTTKEDDEKNHHGLPHRADGEDASLSSVATTVISSNLFGFGLKKSRCKNKHYDSDCIQGKQTIAPTPKKKKKRKKKEPELVDGEETAADPAPLLLSVRDKGLDVEKALCTKDPNRSPQRNNDDVAVASAPLPHASPKEPFVPRACDTTIPNSQGLQRLPPSPSQDRPEISLSPPRYHPHHPDLQQKQKQYNEEEREGILAASEPPLLLQTGDTIASLGLRPPPDLPEKGHDRDNCNNGDFNDDDEEEEEQEDEDDEEGSEESAPDALVVFQSTKKKKKSHPNERTPTGAATRKHSTRPGRSLSRSRKTHTTTKGRSKSSSPSCSYSSRSPTKLGSTESKTTTTQSSSCSSSSSSPYTFHQNKDTISSSGTSFFLTSILSLGGGGGGGNSGFSSSSSSEDDHPRRAPSWIHRRVGRRKRPSSLHRPDHDYITTTSVEEKTAGTAKDAALCPEQQQANLSTTNAAAAFASSAMLAHQPQQRLQSILVNSASSLSPKSNTNNNDSIAASGSNSNQETGTTGEAGEPISRGRSCSPSPCTTTMRSRHGSVLPFRHGRRQRRNSNHYMRRRNSNSSMSSHNGSSSCGNLPWQSDEEEEEEDTNHKKTDSEGDDPLYTNTDSFGVTDGHCNHTNGGGGGLWQGMFQRRRRSNDSMASNSSASAGGGGRGFFLGRRFSNELQQVVIETGGGAATAATAVVHQSKGLHPIPQIDEDEEGTEATTTEPNQMPGSKTCSPDDNTDDKEDQPAPYLKSILRRYSNDSMAPTAQAGGGGGLFRALRRRSSLNSSSSSWSSNPQDCCDVDVIALAQQQNKSQPPQPPLSKRVRFDTDPVSYTLNLSPWTVTELRSVFWTKKEIRQMGVRAQRLADDVAFRKDRKIISCLHLCYGLGHPDQMVRRFSSNGNNPIRAGTAGSGGGGGGAADLSGIQTTQAALQYYYRYEALEPDDEENSTNSSITDRQTTTASSMTSSSPDTAVISEVSSPPPALTTSLPTTTTLRGLERQLSIAVMDYQMQCVHAVLTAQAKMLDDAESWTPRQVQFALYKQSTQVTAQARRFARLLGKADATIIGGKASGAAVAARRGSTTTTPTVSQSSLSQVSSPAVSPQKMDRKVVPLEGKPPLQPAETSAQQQHLEQQPQQGQKHEQEQNQQQSFYGGLSSPTNRRSSESSGSRMVIPWL